eukprot:2047800-Rhodomonas_salina.1
MDSFVPRLPATTNFKSEGTSRHALSHWHRNPWAPNGELRSDGTPRTSSQVSTQRTATGRTLKAPSSEPWEAMARKRGEKVEGVAAGTGKLWFSVSNQ